MTTSYVVGAAVTLSTPLYGPTGALVTGGTVTCTVTDPDGLVTTPAVAETPAASGTYQAATFVATKPGLWRVAWASTAPVVAAAGDQLTVARARPLVASLAEFKAQLNRAGSDRVDDDELRLYLEAATDAVEHLVGPVGVQTVVERREGPTVRLDTRPVVEVVSVAPVVAGVTGALAAASTWAWYTGGRVVLPGAGWWEITVRAGWAGPPAGMRLAGLVIAAHLWELQNGAGGQVVPAADYAVPGLGFAIPRRATEMLRPYGPPDVVPGIA